ncbi:MAG: DUF6573 family protein [Sedimenticolaceae bacterium]
MSNTPINAGAESIFGDVIYSYTRTQAIEDGVLVDAGPMAQEAGFKWPVALTSAVWEDCVAWTDDDIEKQIHQDQSGRLWDLLCMASHAIRSGEGSGDRMLFQLYRVPRNGQSMEAELIKLKLIVGPGDSGEPVITILLLHED